MLSHFICLIAICGLLISSDAFQTFPLPTQYSKIGGFSVQSSLLKGNKLQPSLKNILIDSPGRQVNLELTSTSLASTSSVEDASKLTTKVEQKKTLKKIIPLSLMLFCILFNYTILRDTKDVLVVTAPNSGAEIIPFLKT